MIGDAERRRLRDADAGAMPWRAWGPYLSERAWATVREDYSEYGTVWDYFPHDHARSRAYRWNEDGMAGISDERQLFCFGLALWNGVDPIIKERMFGLDGDGGNHGEDVKDYWWYLDSTPTHSWMTWRYHYPQRPFPYGDLVHTNAHRGRHEPEYELADTGVFDDDRYWAVTVDYAKAAPTDMCITITVANRGDRAGHPARAAAAVVPQHLGLGSARPRLRPGDPGQGQRAGRRAQGTRPAGAGRRRLTGAPVLRQRDQHVRGCGAGPAARRTRRTASTTTWCTAPTRVNPGRSGHQGRAALPRRRAGRASRPQIRLRLALAPDGPAPAHRRGGREALDLGAAFAEVMAARRREADEFYRGARAGRRVRRRGAGRSARPWPG